MSFKLTIQALRQFQGIEEITIQSIDCALYRMVATIDGAEKLITELNGKTLTRTSSSALRDLLQDIDVQEVYLEHHSAYDQMISHPSSSGNQLRTKLSINKSEP